MTLRLTDEQDALLQQLADAQNISKHEAVVRAIEAAVADRGRRRAEILDRIVTEDRALLDLLAQ